MLLGILLRSYLPTLTNIKQVDFETPTERTKVWSEASSTGKIRLELLLSDCGRTILAYMVIAFSHQIETGIVMTSHRQNDLLRAIEAAGIKDLAPYLTIRDLKQQEEIANSGEPISLVYFPHSAVLSCVVGLADGGSVAGGLIGKDGAFGAVQALDSMVSLNKVFVMVPGTASVIEARHLVAAVEAVPALRRILLTYEQFFLAQVQQTAACNALHDIPRRTCRWLLRLEELVGPSFRLTQEALALMMGVRRTSVTSIATKMQTEGLIAYHRGQMELVNIAALRKVACECQAELESHHELVFEQLRRDVELPRRWRGGGDPHNVMEDRN